MRRLLPMARVSLDQGELTDSIERQHAQFADYARRHPTDRLLPVVEDRSVSGAVAPADRPELGPWLEPDRLEQWDGVLVTTQDRLSRSDLHTFAFIARLLELNKQLVIIDDPNLDMATPEGRLQIQVRAFGAAKELERIRARITESHAARRYTRAWQTGIPPYGYVSVVGVVDGKRRKVLTPDDHASSVVRGIADAYLRGDTRSEIAHALTERGELAPYDYHRARHQLDVKGHIWHPNVITDILRSPSTQGVKMHKVDGVRKAVLLPDGIELVIAEPLISADKWSAIQHKLRNEVTGRHRRTSDKLPGLVYCAQCGSRATVSTSRYQRAGGGETVYHTYRCNRFDGRKCRGIRVKADHLLGSVDADIRIRLADREVKTRYWDQGSDAGQALAKVEQAIQRLVTEKDTSDDWDDHDEELYRQRMNSLRERRRNLASEPVRQPSWQEESTGRTYAEVWEETETWSERTKLLQSVGARIYIHPGHEVSVVIPQ